MKKSELRQIIREEISKINEVETSLQVGDMIAFRSRLSDDRGMGASEGDMIFAKVTKVIGPSNVQVEDIETGKSYKVSRKDLIIIPKKGDKITVNTMADGRKSQYTGVVQGVSLSKNEIKFQPSDSSESYRLNMFYITNIKINK